MRSPVTAGCLAVSGFGGHHLSFMVSCRSWSPRKQSVKPRPSRLNLICLPILTVVVVWWRSSRQLYTSQLVRQWFCRSCCSLSPRTVQFLRNGAVRVTFKSSLDCSRVLSSGISFRDVPLPVVSADTRSRLVYLRDCPAEVPDDVVKQFFSTFGEVHSISRSCHQAFPDVHDGNRVIKITLTKDVPGVVSVHGNECRMWYRRQPASLAICRKLGHRSRSCPLNGLCRRCRRPGHHARECTNAWSSAAGPAPFRGSAANPSRPASASAAAPADPVVPPYRPASSDAVPSDPVDASAVQDDEMTDEEYVPSMDVDSDPASMNAVAASGDDEVVLTALPPTSSSSPRRRCKRRRRAVSSAVPCVLVDMDTSEVEVPGHKQFKTFLGVWDDVVSWEELRAKKPRYRVTVTPPEPSPPPPSPSPSLSASLPTPVPPASPIPSTFSSNGSVVDSVPTPTPGRPRAAPPYHFNRPQRGW